MGGVVLDPSAYTYNPETGEFVLDNVNGPVTIKAVGESADSERHWFSWLIWTLSWFAGTLGLLLIILMFLIGKHLFLAGKDDGEEEEELANA